MEILHCNRDFKVETWSAYDRKQLYIDTATLKYLFFTSVANFLLPQSHFVNFFNFLSLYTQNEGPLA